MSEKKEDPTYTGDFGDRMISIWEKFNVFSTIEEGDSILMVIGKVFVRIVGFLIMLALSPFILLGFLLMFAAVS
jgi:hypothetical protein